MNLLIRRLGVVLAVLLLVGGIVGFNALQSRKEAPPVKTETPRIFYVDTFIAYNATLPGSLDIDGQLVAYNKIDIFAEVSGTLRATSRPFKVGTAFEKGTVMIDIDDAEARLNLLSQKSNLLNAITRMMPDLKIDYPESFGQWEAYLNSFDPEAPLRPFPAPVSQQEKYFVASNNIQGTYYTIKSAEERLGKYRIYAPFTGVLTQVNINPGALVRTGQLLGVLMNPADYELEATIALSDLPFLKTGNRVSLQSEDIPGDWQGRIKRINDQVDANTQTVKVFVEVEGKDLREGMYLKGQAVAAPIEDALAVPRDLLVNQNAVYTVENEQVKLKMVEVLRLTPKEAIVRGIPDGTVLLAKILPGTFDGLNVKINSRD
ncbi:MAG: HlyD family efflux transporter periplasmic adaptor subunit [Saprospiraceae bacterium]|nr:HlyD family efflux transporter periplasmic adaptor subunit [Saprospiraceae bacterium]MDP4819571.1 HlyD family efflux transporter periplasmic adaptor subunit [Saprospiraceae bacterium]MDP4999727.1 HlyD family efflux transporter periplasmic adaptor subunit [Saprospiraceae bacterium]